ncbi:uncharacterized protein [Dermacentor albipictus]|uniref:uncharacterized protein isoform X12 n=1 Tax=Dermacentor albipictus TaxID=60249 RepID=UPI0038FC06D0
MFYPLHDYSHRSCIVQWCRNTSRTSHAVFFRVPKDNRMEAFLEYAGRTDLMGLPRKKVNNYRICSAHFTDGDFMDPAETRLVWSAVPSVKAPHELSESKDDAASPVPLLELKPEPGMSELYRDDAVSPAPLLVLKTEPEQLELYEDDAVSPAPLLEPKTEPEPFGLYEDDAVSPAPLLVLKTEPEQLELYEDDAVSPAPLLVLKTEPEQLELYEDCTVSPAPLLEPKPEPESFELYEGSQARRSCRGMDRRTRGTSPLLAGPHQRDSALSFLCPSNPAVRRR